jgi:hypothetical protein
MLSIPISTIDVYSTREGSHTRAVGRSGIARGHHPGRQRVERSGALEGGPDSEICAARLEQMTGLGPATPHLGKVIAANLVTSAFV